MGFLYHIVLILLCLTSALGCGISMNYGNITLDQDLEVNDTLRIQCSLFNSSIVYKNDTYTVSSENLFLKFESEYLQDIEILDDLSIEYTVENAHEDDSGTYSCYVSIPEINKNALVCSTYMAVGYKPKPVENFSCISYEYTNLTCSWVKPFNPVRTEYKLWDYIGLETWKRACPKVISDTSCCWTMDSRPQYRRPPEKLYFLVTGKNSLGESKQYMVQDHFKIVKPGIPRNVMIMNETETSVVIHWSPPRYMEYQAFAPGLEYSVSYQPILNYPSTVQEVTEVFYAEGSMRIGDLIPHTRYRFSIRCRSSRVDNDDFWSPSVPVVVVTKPDVPYLAPEMAPSSFDVENILGNRTVTVYWKAVPAEFENGRNFHYVIQFHLHHVISPSRIVRHTYELDVGNKTLHSFPHMDSHSAYIFKIYAVNSMGPSLNSSQIIIDKADKLLERPKDITVISYGQGKFNLSWKASNQRPYNFTVFWCKTVKPRPSKCDGPLEWLHTTKTKHVLHLPDKDTSYQFAVSANDEGHTSGMSWASCIVYYKGVNYNVRKVELQPKNATSLKIQWSLECEAQKIIMKEYAIQYCEFQGPCSQPYNTKSCSDWKTVNVSDVSKEEYVLGSLKPYSNYMAFIRAHTINGWSGNSNLACEMTMSTAPSDSPHNVRVINVDGKYITVSFEPPKIPNGVISRYVAYYNKSDGTSHHKEFRINEMTHSGDVFSVNLVDFMAYYTNYSIEMVACVGQACSEKSQPVYAFTSISYPDIITSPRIEVTNEAVNITWDDPVLSNGPLDYYQIFMEGHNSSKLQVFNVTGQNYFIFHPNCTEKDDTVYNFRVRAVNIRNGAHLYGRYSNPTKNKLCSGAGSIAVTVGIAVGSTVGVILLILLIYGTATWMKKEVDLIRGINVRLPKALESPMENPLSSYDKFEKGIRTNHDSAIPRDTSYERLCEFAQEKDLGIVTEENSQKLKRKSSGRNNSGESNASGKCHDSISSSNTTKTHLSIDSGAEVDSPPSPDGLFSDTSSSHTTPRSYKPDLTIVQEGNGCTSKDSGLEREGMFVNHNVHLPSKFAYFVKKKNYPYGNIHIPNGDAKIASYSKFAVRGANNAPPFIPYGEQSLGLLEQKSLSNSEPSVAEFDVIRTSEPAMPYSKFGLARSDGNGLHISNQPLSSTPKMGYSKFGMVYRALKWQESNNIPTFHGSAQTCPKFLPHNPQTFTALTVSHYPEDKQPLVKDNDKAYSKFGVSAPKNIPVNGYVCFKDTLSYPSADSGANQAYSKLGITSNKRSQPESDNVKENGVIINPAELQALPLSSQIPHASLGNTKGTANSLLKEGNSPSKPEAEPSTANHKDDAVEEDRDNIVPDSSTSLLEEITSDLGSKLKPTNFTISANNDSKGFLLQGEENDEPTTQLTNIMDALFGTYDFHIPEDGSIPISINMEDLSISNSNTDICEHCSNLVTECTCSVAKNPNQTEVICNGHTSPLPNLSTDYVPVGCKPAC